MKKAIATPVWRAASLSCAKLALLVGGATVEGARQAQAQCVPTGAAIGCTGELSPGQDELGGFDSLTVNGLTSDLTGFGIRVRDTSPSDFTFNTNFGAFNINLTNGSVEQRNGFNIISDGAISGTLDADITGQVADDATNVTFFVRNFAAFGVEAASGINVQNTGTIDLALPTVTRATTGARADVITGRFAAIRAESDAGNVTIDNDASVTLDGGQRVASNSRTGGLAGVRSIDFTNGVSDIAGISAQGNAALVIDQMGDVTVSGGGADLAATTVDDTADINGDFAETTGIYVPAFTTSGGTFDPDLPRFQSVDIDFVGDVNVTGSDVTSTATVTSNGGAVGEAISTASGRQEAAGIAVGSSFTGNGQTIDVSVTGNIMVNGGAGTAEAFASEGGPGETAGRVYAIGGGQDAVGVSLIADNGPDDDLETEVDVFIDGDVTVFGGDGFSNSTGAATGEVTLFRPDASDSFETGQRSQSNGGDADGIQFVRQTDRSSFDITGDITVGGGSATAEHTGDSPGLFVNSRGGPTAGLRLITGREGVAHTASLDVDFNLVLPDATTTVSGDGVLGRAFGSFHRGFFHSFFSDGSQLTYSGNVTNTPGNIRVEATDGAFVDTISPGGVIGLNTVMFARESAETGTFIFDGNIDLTGSAVSVSGDLSPSETVVENALNLSINPDLLVGQAAFGIFAEAVAFEPNTATVIVDHRGSIDLTAGTGPAGLGEAVGIALFGDFDPNLNGRARVAGTINVTGSDTADTLGTQGSDESAGVRAEMSGLAEIDVDGGTINATGTNAAGIQANSATSNIMVRNGGTVTGTGANTAGISLGSFLDFSNTVGPTGQIFDSSMNTVTVGPNGTVSSTDFIGIHDRNERRFRNFSIPDRISVPFPDEPSDNATTVDIAGTVTGGNGVAIDLGSGPDTLILQQTATINGSITLGSGEDTFVYQGFVEDEAADGGDDRDRIAVTVGNGLAQTFDPSVETPNLINFEAIAKDGAGTLTLPGGSFANGPLAFEVNEGTGIVSGDRPNTAVFVGNGASFQTDNRVAAVTTNVGGTFSGIGGSDAFMNNGTLAPGNSIGTFTVDGDFTQSSTGVLEIEIDADGNSDLVQAFGEASLAGTLSILGIDYPEGYPNSQTYTVVQAAEGVSGTFDTVTDNLPDVDVEADYQDTQVQISYARATDDLSDKSIHGNTLQGTALVSRLFSQAIRERSRARNVFAGAAEPAPFSAVSALSFAGTPSDSAASPFSHDANAIEVWFGGMGSLASIDGTAAATGYDLQTGGLVGGADLLVDNANGLFRVGVAAGYSVTDLDGVGSDADIDAWHVGAHASFMHGPFLVSGSFAYGAFDYDLSRTIPMAGSAPAIADASTDGQSFQASAQAFFDLARHMSLGSENALRFGPTASVDYVWTERDGYTETGAGMLNLTLSDESYDRTWLGLGLELSASHLGSNGSVITPSLAIKYEHGMGSYTARIRSSIAGVADASFSDVSAELGDHMVALDAGLNIELNDHLSLTMTYNGSFSADSTTHNAALTASLSF